MSNFIHDCPLSLTSYQYPFPQSKTTTAGKQHPNYWFIEFPIASLIITNHGTVSTRTIQNGFTLTISSRASSCKCLPASFVNNTPIPGGVLKNLS